jgi:hypothetical protein
MNYTIFFAVMNLILVSRLKLTLRDEGVNDKRSLVLMGLIPLPLVVFFEPNLSTFLLLAYLLLTPCLNYLLEMDQKNLNRNRFSMLVIHLFIIAMLTGRLYDLTPAPWLGRFESFLIETFAPAGEAARYEGRWLSLNAMLFGFLIILNEVNIMVRLMLTRLGLSPLGRKKGGLINDEQYRTGRVIGFLERIFVFVFILLQQYAAVGFILAAKGIVRYPDFGNRTFAEYILIGTLLSTLFAMILAFLTGAFIQI